MEKAAEEAARPRQCPSVQCQISPPCLEVSCRSDPSGWPGETQLPGASIAVYRRRSSRGRALLRKGPLLTALRCS